MISSIARRFIGRHSFCFREPQGCCFILLGLVLLCCVVCANGQDENATRGSVPTTRSKARKSENGGRHPRKSPQPKPDATVTIKVDPADSTVFVDGQQLDTTNSMTGLRLAGLKPGPHTLTVRHPPSYAENEQIVTLKPGENEPLTITLEPLIGNLDVVPSVGDSQIKIESIDSNQRVQLGTYSGRVSSLALAPGLYDITISKSGYEVTTRRIAIKPGESMFLEPQLLPLPKPTPTPVPRQSITTVPLRSTVETAGRYVIVQLYGSSGDAAKSVGTINVTLGAHGEHSVTGVLPGQPCQVQFVQLENVAESSLVEGPGPSNQWAKIVVRVRPKSSKRAIAFAVNWSLVGSSPLSSNLAQSVLVETTAIERGSQILRLARSQQMTGTIDLWILSTVRASWRLRKPSASPRCFDRLLEDAVRKLKFRPATQNGQPIESAK